MTSPSGNIRPPSNQLEDRVRELEQIVASLVQKPVRNAGDFTIKTPAGTTSFRSGPHSGAFAMPDGSPQWITQIRDMNDLFRFGLFDKDPLDASPYQIFWMYDQFNQITFTQDNNGGWAEPWLPIVMYPKISVAAGVYSYLSTAVNVAEQQLWEGRIGYVSHTRIQVNGVWGQSSGSGQTTRYRLKVGGVTVGTWDIGGLEVSIKGPFVHGQAIGTRNAVTEITAQSLAGTGVYACQVLGCDQRQT